MSKTIDDLTEILNRPEVREQMAALTEHFRGNLARRKADLAAKRAGAKPATAAGGCPFAAAARAKAAAGE